MALGGVKPWCSGAGLCSHALVTAHGVDGNRDLFAVDLAQPGVTPLASSWRNAGMATSDTRSVRFDDAPAMPIGAPGDYLARPGFWHGAIGVAACWLGGARAVAARLYRAVAEQDGGASANPHAQAHLGAVDAALAATEAMLSSAADFVDTEPSGGRTELIARRVRAVAETAVDEAITRTGRALGPAPLALDADHARRVADLTHVRAAEPRRTGSGRARSIGMPVTGTGNAARFAARPLSGGGTSALAWTAGGRRFLELDLTGCKSLLVVAPHPDDETLGFGAAAATLQSRGVKVQVVSVTDGDASHPGLPMRGRRKLAGSVAPNCEARQVFSHYLHRFLSACPMAKSAPTYANWPNYSPHCSPKRLAHGVPPPGAATGIPTMKPSERRRRSRPTARATRLVEYPLWMWHWATPNDDAVPWERASRISPNRVGLERKWRAAEMYRTQLEPHRSSQAVLPPFVLDRLRAVGEVVFT